MTFWDTHQRAGLRLPGFRNIRASPLGQPQGVEGSYFLVDPANRTVTEVLSIVVSRAILMGAQREL